MELNWMYTTGMWYTEPRRFTVEVLPNGLFRLYAYGSGLACLHDNLAEAKAEASNIVARERLDLRDDLKLIVADAHRRNLRRNRQCDQRFDIWRG